MGSKIRTFVINLLVWIVFSIFLTLPLLALKLWKSLVILQVKFLRPSLKAFKASDSMTTADSIYTKPLLSIGFVCVLESVLSITEFRNHFSKTLLPVSRHQHSHHPNLLVFFKQYFGYPFKQLLEIEDIHLEDLIYEAELLGDESFSDFMNRFFYAPYEDGKPLWNIALLQSVQTDESQIEFYGTTVLFRIHHCLADGLSLNYLFEQLTSCNGGGMAAHKSKSKMIPFRIGIWDKIRIVLSSPWPTFKFMDKINKAANPFVMSGNCAEVTYSFVTLDLQVIKNIRKNRNVRITSILLTLLGGVLRRILLEKYLLGDNDLPQYIYVANPLPWPEHPRNHMCNEWTLGMFRVPIQNPNPLERVLETDRDYEDFHHQEINKIIKFLFIPIFSLLPVVWARKAGSADSRISTSWSTVMGTNDYKLLGIGVKNVWPFVGITTPRMSLVAVSMSHSGKIDVTLGFNREFVHDPSEIKRITEIWIPQELDNLVQLTTEL